MEVRKARLSGDLGCQVVRLTDVVRYFDPLLCCHEFHENSDTSSAVVWTHQPALCFRVDFCGFPTDWGATWIVSSGVRAGSPKIIQRTFKTR